MTVAATLRGVTDTSRHFAPNAQAAPASARRAGLLVAAVVLLAVGGLAGAMLASGKGPIGAIQAAIGAGSFTVSGSITLTGDNAAISTTCGGKGAFADVTEGAAITITDGAGAVIGMGRLGAGHLETAGCILDFAIADVPSGKGFYGVEVAHHGAVKYSEAEISKGRLALGLT